jgi:hypothetical protein
MNTLTGERHKLEITFGYGHVDWNVREFFVANLPPLLTEKFGGFRTDRGTGYWRMDGNQSPPYSGELMEEDSVTVTITTDEDVNTAMAHIRLICRKAKRQTEGDVPMEWVNVEVTECQARHFAM